MRAGPWRGVLLAAGAALCTAAVQAQCSTVYDRAGAVVYESPQTPVDLRLQLGDTVPPRFGPGATLVFTLHQVDSCGRSGTGATSGYQADAAGLRPTGRRGGDHRAGVFRRAAGAGPPLTGACPFLTAQGYPLIARFRGGIFGSMKETNWKDTAVVPGRAILCTVLFSAAVAGLLAWMMESAPLWLLLLILLLPVSIVVGFFHDQEAAGQRRAADERALEHWSESRQPPQH
ncbi:hypothetical protein [Xylophilus sp.]|uniref:hypothetical protein n=1 Tax=Xylophilus sp. TaxID=2653893 RepID=UPI002D7FFF44|nr:hypothetical protein [Xylophilus sp.]